jgi:hypothetical protein
LASLVAEQLSDFIFCLYLIGYASAILNVKISWSLLIWDGKLFQSKHNYGNMKEKEVKGREGKWEERERKSKGKNMKTPKQKLPTNIPIPKSVELFMLPLYKQNGKVSIIRWKTAWNVSVY